MTIRSESGGSYDFWIKCLQDFVRETNALMSVDMDGVRRFPANVPCILFYNLNAICNKANRFIGMPPDVWVK
eukprot:653879-Heterocapsa_arctica.AAC.1